MTAATLAEARRARTTGRPQTPRRIAIPATASSFTSPRRPP